MKKLMSIIISICLLSASCPALAASAADFSDVKSSDWYYSAVDYVTGLGLFSGTSATAFSPKSTMNRAMFVTVLGRYAGVSGTATADVAEAVNMRSGPGTDSSVVTVLTAGSRVNITGLEKGWYAVTKGPSSGYVRSDLLKVNNGGFSDVSGASYYCAYVNWCSANGIAGGTGGTSFSPSAAITREQICAILYRYAQKFGVSLPETVSAAAFSDDAAISASARDGVYAMQRAGVVSGRGGNAFCPRATASRAEVAAIMMRFIECVKTQPKPDYGYAGTVPASAAAADGYFDDACFIGHSIVVGMSMYLGLPNAQYYAVNGISAKRMLTYDGFTLPDGGTGTVSDALTGSSFGKVYIMLGVNELGSADYDLQSYYDSMISLISMVKDKLPQAKIYLISIMPVTQTESDSSQNYNLQNIVRFNTKLQQISRETGAGYLDFFTLFADNDGYMPPECAASDGIHPLQSQYAVMNGYIKTHT